MTTATFTLPRETVVLDGGVSTAPLPVTRPEPLAPIRGRHRIDYRRFVDPMNTRTVAELLAVDAVWSGRLGRRHTFAPWLTFALWAVAVPLLFALLAGCQDDWPTTDGPATTVPVPEPAAHSVPFVPAWVAGDVPTIGEFPVVPR